MSNGENEDESIQKQPRLIYYSLYIGMAIKTCDLIQHHWKQASSELRNIEKLFFLFSISFPTKNGSTRERKKNVHFFFLSTQLTQLGHWGLIYFLRGEIRLCGICQFLRGLSSQQQWKRMKIGNSSEKRK